jgi:hypothetical protein
MSLQDYQIDTASLLHDQNNLFTGLFQLNRWINEARDQVAMDTGCLPALVPGQAPFGAGAQAGSAVAGGAIPGMQPTNGFQTIAGQEVYAYAFANETLNQQYRGYRAVIDVFTVAVSWGGSIRPVQNWMPWDDLQAYARSYNIGVFSYPFVWSDTGTSENGQIWLWPAPSVVTEMEWQTICVPTPLYSNDDYDALPLQFRKAVKFYAASLAKMASNQYEAAETLQQKYIQQIGVASGSSARARVPDYYRDWTQW